jgi:hypothetical protein
MPPGQGGGSEKLIFVTCGRTRTGTLMLGRRVIAASARLSMLLVWADGVGRCGSGPDNAKPGGTNRVDDDGNVWGGGAGMLSSVVECPGWTYGPGFQ